MNYLQVVKKYLTRKKLTLRIIRFRAPSKFLMLSINTGSRQVKKKPDAFIALGCVIKGDTPHFEYVCRSVTDGITALNLQLPVPVIFGVLTVNTEEQARQRVGGIHGHKGEEAAEAAIKMISFSRSL